MELNVILAQATLSIMVIMMSSVALSADEAPIARTGCNDSCGNVSIPFPFGTSAECSLDNDFLIDCRNSSNINGFTPFWRNLTILSISVEKGQLKVLHPVIAAGCYSNFSKSLDIDGIMFNFAPFTIDNTSNLLFVTGCDTYSLFQGTLATRNFTRNYVFGCIAYCDTSFKLEITSCSDGFGCCRTTVPSELTFFFASMIRMTSNGPIDPDACSYSFIADKTAFDDNILRRKYSISATSVFPVVLNWFVSSNNRCRIDVKNSSNYACKEGSSCLEVRGEGYRCVCPNGFDGNPYLEGCTDIDECARLDHGCAQDCVNIRGGYTCQCRTGYYGDGYKNNGTGYYGNNGRTYAGTGCIQIKRSNKYILIVAVGVTALGLSLLAAASYLLYKTIKKRRDKNRKSKFFKKNGGQLLDQLSENGDHIDKVHIFTAQELDKVTDHFNENRVLGRGGQGTVYKGMLSDGKIIAVKKSKLDDTKQVEQFINEVVILSYIDHRNVVKLLGCCLETEVPLLVYEFISNGTLYDLIHNNEGDDFPLSWEVRLRIATEVARALSYLHSTTSIPVYHRDIKSSNILLDEKYRAKVSDFGISRHISIEQTHLTTLVKGTFGYLDPEYFQSSQFTDKSDVYSFGVVLVELLTGRKPISSYWVEEEEYHESLATKFLQSMEDNSLHVILDARVLEGATVEELGVVSRLAQSCLSLDGRRRPTMSQVAMELEGMFQCPHLPSLAEPNFDAGEIGTSSEILELSNGSEGTSSFSVDEFPLLSDT